MCRWLAYTGDPVLLDELLYKPKYSLIVQSLHSRLGAETNNGDGFGVGWYGAQLHARGSSVASNPPGTTATCGSWPCTWPPRWCWPTSAPPAPRRSSRRTAIPSGTAAGSGCTTGPLRDFPAVKGTCALAVDPELYPHIEGSTDSSCCSS